MTSCVRQASASGAGSRSTDYCSLTLRCIEQRLSLARFLKLNADLIQGRSDPDEQAALACARAAVKRALPKQPSKEPSL